MMSIENYKKELESMSKEELLHEISNLISDHGIQLQNKNIELQELKSALARADLQLQFQIGEVDLNNREIELLTEDNKRLNELLVGGTEVIDYWNNKYLEEQAKNTELQKQVDELKERLHMIFALGFDYDGCDKAESLKWLIDELVKITQMDSKEFAEYYKGVEVE